ncbi:MAG: BrnT family toxin [Acetobacteraceae bacterium]
MTVYTNVPIFPASFEWDEAKRVANLAKHGLDFIDAKMLFDGRPQVTYQSPREEELRHVTVGVLGGAFVAAVWTERGRAIRLISLRRARHGEEWEYRARFGGGRSGDA